LAAANPVVVDYRKLLAIALTDLASPHGLNCGIEPEEVEKAARAGRRAVQLLRALSAAQPRVVEYSRSLVTCYDNLAQLHSARGESHEMAVCLEKAIEAAQPLIGTPDGLLLVGKPLTTAYMALGELRLESGDKTVARGLLERGEDFMARLVAAAPSVGEYRDRLRATRFYLSMLDLEAGRLDEAERRSRQVLALGAEFDRLFPEMALLPPTMTSRARFGSEHRDLARILEAQGRLQEAVDLYDKAIAILEDAARRQPRDQCAPKWLTETRRSREKARAKQAGRIRADASGLPRPPEVTMPNGSTAFRKE
jgi:tetratricopeptide (TPR) repeat protein